MKYLLKRYGLATSLILLATVGQAAASDLFSEPIVMASLSVPLAGGLNRSAQPQFGLSVYRRDTGSGWRTGMGRHRVMELTARFASPSAMSLNGVPLWESPLQRNAGSSDTEMTTEEKVGTIAIVGLAIAGAAGVVVVFND